VSATVFLLNLFSKSSYSSLFRTDFSLFGGAESLTEGRIPTLKTTRSPRRVFSAEERTKGGRDAHSAAPQDPSEFLWLMTEEPHRTRRMAIMKAHPEVRYFVLLIYKIEVLTVPI
jgi:hypothetical protein